MRFLTLLLLWECLSYTPTAAGQNVVTDSIGQTSTTLTDTVPDLDTVSLDGVTVTANRNSRDAVNETIVVTKEMRKGTNSAISLLGKVPGIVLDRMDESIRIGTNLDVPIIVDGKEVSKDYAKSLNPDRVYKVEILRHPAGRYAEFPVVVNLVLKTTYTGLDVNLQTRGIVSLRNKHSNTDRAEGGFNFSNPRCNVYSLIGYTHRDVYKATAYTRDVEGKYTEETIPVDEKHPNGRYLGNQWSAFAGLDYKINHNNTISIQGSALANHASSQTEYTMSGIYERARQHSRYKTNEFSGGIFYKGTFADKLNVNVEGFYDYYHINDNYKYLTGDAMTEDAFPTTTSGNKHFVRGDINASYKFTDRLSLLVDEMFSLRKYSLDDMTSENGDYMSTEYRNRADINLMWNPLTRFSINGGLTLLTVRNEYTTKGIRTSVTHCSPLPYAKVFWQFTKKMSLSANYFYDIFYPNLDLLSPARQTIGNSIYSEGNPALRAKEIHYIEAELAFKRFLKFSYLTRFERHDITPWYFKDGGDIVTTWVNSSNRFSRIALEASMTVANNLNFNILGSYSWYKRSGYGNVQGHGRTWYLETQFAYSIKKIGIDVLAQYLLRHDKLPLLQGMQHGEEEKLAIGATKTFWNNRIFINLMSTIPVNAISKTGWTSILIPGYRYTVYENDKVNQTVLLLNIRLMFGNRKSSSRSNSLHIEQERE